MTPLCIETPFLRWFLGHQLCFVVSFPFNPIHIAPLAMAEIDCSPHNFLHLLTIEHHFVFLFRDIRATISSSPVAAAHASSYPLAEFYFLRREIDGLDMVAHLLYLWFVVCNCNVLTCISYYLCICTQSGMILITNVDEKIAQFFLIKIVEPKHEQSREATIHGKIITSGKDYAFHL